MSDMKCPICGNDLEQYHTGLVCYRHCLNGKNVWGSEETLKELNRTRKALDLAIKHLQGIRGCDKNGRPMTGVISCWIDCDELAKALEQITALEQKDGK